jgi:lysophospholipase L1-like esterase
MSSPGSQPIVSRRFVALGDSITWGYPHGPHASWVQRAADLARVEIINMGVNGDTLADMRQRIGAVLALRPMACIITGGVNDVCMGRRVPDMAADLGAMVADLAEAGVVPVIGMPPPCLEPRGERELVAYRHFINSLAGTRHLRVVPFERAFIQKVEGATQAPGPVASRVIHDLFIDTTHPAELGYAAMAEVLLSCGVLSMGAALDDADESGEDR